MSNCAMRSTLRGIRSRPRQTRAHTREHGDQGSREAMRLHVRISALGCSSAFSADGNAARTTWIGFARRASREVGDLVPAARAVGDDERVRRRGAHRRQQRELRHSHRHVVVRGIVAEAAGHAAAARSRSSSTARPGTRRSTSASRATASNAFWWQWPCSSARVCGSARERQAQASGAMLARQEFLDQERAVREPLRVVAETHHQELVAQRQRGTTARGRRSRRRARRAARAPRRRGALRASLRRPDPRAR